MTAHTTPFPVAEEPSDSLPFEEGDELSDDAPSESVAAALACVAELGLNLHEIQELAILLAGEIAADLSDSLEAGEIDAEGAASVIDACARLQVAAEVLASVGLEGDDEDYDDLEAEESDDLAAA